MTRPRGLDHTRLTGVLGVRDASAVLREGELGSKRLLPETHTTEDPNARLTGNSKLKKI